jgi:hypothetical protein
VQVPDLNVSPPMPAAPTIKKSRSVHVTTPKYPDTAPDAGSWYGPYHSARHSEHVPTGSRFAEHEPVLREDIIYPVQTKIKDPDDENKTRGRSTGSKKKV